MPPEYPNSVDTGVVEGGQVKAQGLVGATQAVMDTPPFPPGMGERGREALVEDRPMPPAPGGTLAGTVDLSAKGFPMEDHAVRGWEEKVERHQEHAPSKREALRRRGKVGEVAAVVVEGNGRRPEEEEEPLPPPIHHPRFPGFTVPMAPGIHIGTVMEREGGGNLSAC